MFKMIKKAYENFMSVDANEIEKELEREKEYFVFCA